MRARATRLPTPNNGALRPPFVGRAHYQITMGRLSLRPPLLYSTLGAKLQSAPHMAHLRYAVCWSWGATDYQAEGQRTRLEAMESWEDGELECRVLGDWCWELVFRCCISSLSH